MSEPLQKPPTPGTLETPSGKTAADENFPVGSWLIRPDLRRHVHIFYNFAPRGRRYRRQSGPGIRRQGRAPSPHGRDHPRLGRPLDRRIRVGGLRADARKPGRDRRHGTAQPGSAEGLHPGRQQDALSRLGRSAGLLPAVGRPVGRQLLDLHGEGPGCRPGADALCNALQVINHLQDCADDYRALDRVYLPTGLMEQEGATIGDLSRPALTPALRRVLDRTIAPLEGLLAQCADLVTQVDDVRIALECQVIRTLAVRLTARLKAEDPIATRVALSKPMMGGLSLAALASGMVRRRFRPAHRSVAQHP